MNMLCDNAEITGSYKQHAIRIDITGLDSVQKMSDLEKDILLEAIGEDYAKNYFNPPVSLDQSTPDDESFQTAKQLQEARENENEMEVGEEISASEIQTERRFDEQKQSRGYLPRRLRRAG